MSVEIIHNRGIVVLRSRNSELLILPQHVLELRKISDPKKFSVYFTTKALINRPARKLFEAWLRKDNAVWPRLFQVIHKEIKDSDFESESESLEDKKIETSSSSDSQKEDISKKD